MLALTLLNLICLSRGAIQFLVLGDWGMGNDQQMSVSKEMQAYATLTNSSFVINVGDNFYKDNDAQGNRQGGVTNLSDPLWISYFENVYNNSLKNTTFYSILGNHDYMGNITAQLLYGSINDTRWYLPTRNYTVQMNISKLVSVTFIYFDTSPFITEYYINPENQWMADNLQTQNSTEQYIWLEDTLNKTTTEWVIVIGHHPILASKSTVATNSMAPIQKLLNKYGVQAYFCGHVHDLEHMQDDYLVDYFISGAGATGKIYEINADMRSKVQWQSDDAGFMSVTLTEDNMKSSFIDTNGTVLYEYVTSRKGPSSRRNLVATLP